MDCARCGKPLADGASFCNYCGSFVQAEETADKPAFQLTDKLEPVVSRPPEKPPQPYYGLAYPAAPQPAKKKISGKMIALFAVLFVVLMGGLIVAGGILMSRVVPDDEKVMDYYNESLAHYFDENYEAAIENLDSLIELEEDFGGAYRLRGDCHYELGMYEQAVEDYSDAIDTNPDYSYTYLERAMARIELEDFEKAVKDCDKAIELGFGAALAFTTRGIAYAGLGRFEDALKDIDLSLQVQPRRADFYRARADVYRDAGQYDQALANYDMALNLDPGDAKTYMERGIAFYEMGENEKAAADLQRTLELDPDIEEAVEYLQKLGVPGY